ncbi:hypothetical protein [Streptomyces caniscabiei]|uniref:hypothetical protein n=1 Tax=Streptomyces caniscabiei TaxID=2746961 RepID=UPI0015C4E8BA|nr:hypothetical protein [Streptomyces caniscabiei]
MIIFRVCGRTSPDAGVCQPAEHDRLAGACLKPRQLITFSGLTLGAYIAFAAA